MPPIQIHLCFRHKFISFLCSSLEPNWIILLCFWSGSHIIWFKFRAQLLLYNKLRQFKYNLINIFNILNFDEDDQHLLNTSALNKPKLLYTKGWRAWSPNHMQRCHFKKNLGYPESVASMLFIKWIYFEFFLTKVFLNNCDNNAQSTYINSAK